MAKSPQPQGRGGRGQRPLVRVRRSEAHLFNLLQRRPAPGHVPRRVRNHDIHGQGEKIADLYRGADPPNTIDRSHAAHFIPRPRGREPTHETGFGRLSQGWNQFPFSHRERILNTLSKGESLNPEQIAALESGLDGYRAAEGGLSSSQYRAMVDMISELGDQHRRARWHMHGWRGQRLLQLIEMLDYATVVV